MVDTKPFPVDAGYFALSLPAQLSQDPLPRLRTAHLHNQPVLPGLRTFCDGGARLRPDMQQLRQLSAPRRGLLHPVRRPAAAPVDFKPLPKLDAGAWSFNPPYPLRERVGAMVKFRDGAMATHERGRPHPDPYLPGEGIDKTLPRKVREQVRYPAIPPRSSPRRALRS